MAEPEVRDGSAVGAGRIAVRVHCEFCSGAARLTDHGEAFELARVWIFGFLFLFDTFDLDCSLDLLLLIEFSNI